MEFSDGALVRLRVPIRIDADAGRDVLTDIDVFAMDVDGRLRLSRSILECKSGKGQSGEPDRILWLVGLQKYLNFERAVLVRQTISRRGRSLARALGMKLLDVQTLSTREQAHAWMPERFAHLDGPECTAAEARMDTQLKALGHIPSDLVAFLRHDALRGQPYESLLAISALGRHAEQGGVLPSPTREMIAGHALTALVIAAITDAGALDEISLSDLAERTRRSLTTGSPDGTQILDILSRADELTAYSLNRVHEAYQAGGAKRIQVELPSLREAVATPPDWVPRYVDFVDRLRVNPSVARQLPQTIELAVFESLAGGSAHEARSFDRLFTPDHRYLLNVAIRCLLEISGASIVEPLAPVMKLDFNRNQPSSEDRDVPDL